MFLDDKKTIQVITIGGKGFCLVFLMLVFLTLFNKPLSAAFGAPLVSPDDRFKMSFLDLDLIPQSFVSADDSSSAGSPNMHLGPGQAVEKNINRQAPASLAGEVLVPYQFDVTLTHTGGDLAFCSMLKLAVYDSQPTEGNQLYPANQAQDSGDLLTQVLVQTPGGGQNLTGVGGLVFKVFYPADELQVYNKICKFKIKFHFYQASVPSPGLTGLQDDEEEECVIQSTPDLDTLLPRYVSDTHFEQASPDQNFGTSTSMFVTSRNLNRDRYGAVKFNLNLPSGSVVSSAKLKLFLISKTGATSSSVNVHRITSPFTPAFQAWNTLPTFDPVPSAGTSTTALLPNSFAYWDVTQDVQSFISGSATNFGWIIKDNVSNSSALRNFEFAASENSARYAPGLEITFSAPIATTNHVVINEVFANAIDGSPETQFVELYNPTSTPIDVSTWFICDDTGTVFCDRISAGSFPIPAQGFAIIVKDKDALDNMLLTNPLPLPACTSVNYPNCVVVLRLNSLAGSGLAPYGDRLILNDQFEAEIDSVSFGLDTTINNPAVPYAGLGQSIARVVKGFDNDLTTDWIVNATPNPGTNPSSTGGEIMVFTPHGVYVADAAKGIPPTSQEGNLIVSNENLFEGEVLAGTGDALTLCGRNGTDTTPELRSYGLGNGTLVSVCEISVSKPIFLDAVGTTSPHTTEAAEPVVGPNTETIDTSTRVPEEAQAQEQEQVVPTPDEKTDIEDTIDASPPTTYESTPTPVPDESPPASLP